MGNLAAIILKQTWNFEIKKYVWNPLLRYVADVYHERPLCAPQCCWARLVFEFSQFKMIESVRQVVKRLLTEIMLWLAFLEKVKFSLRPVKCLWWTCPSTSLWQIHCSLVALSSECRCRSSLFALSLKLHRDGSYLEFSSLVSSAQNDWRNMLWHQDLASPAFFLLCCRRFVRHMLLW